MAEGSRRVIPTLLLGMVAVVAVLGLLAGPSLAVRFAPASVAFEEGAPGAVVEGFAGPAGAYVVGYEHDAYTTLTVSLQSVGPVSVEVLDVRLASQAAPLLVQSEASGVVALPAGETAAVELPVRFDNCEAYHERESMVVEAVEVTARLWGRTVVERVPLDRPMMARSPMLWQCPDRTIDREDDRRTNP